MSNSYRIRTEVGKDKSIKVQLEQDFEFLEILSLKIVQSQVYARPCSDYGVVIGRVSVNDGFGLPNCKVSIFVPLSDEDSLNPIISDLYPYRSLSDVNDDGYRYNLLPYTKSYSAHAATGTFFTREDVLIDTNLIEVYDKYYKYNAVTNDSGDFMIFGVPVGTQTIHLDVDLSDIGEFSLSPQDLIRMGRATEAQVSGTEFRTSSNLNALPQLVTINRTVEVEPFWGQEQICNIGISRVDFDLTTEANIVIEPTAIFMGSIISSEDTYFQKRSCKPKNKLGNLCQLVAGPGEILAIRQTINQDSNGRPILETVKLDQGGQVIDENGTWMLDVPMNLDYVITNEFGEQVLSNDPKKGIPTAGKYRFKVKWNQSPSLSETTKRGYFLVPNVKEHGWNNGSGTDPLVPLSPGSSDYEDALRAYSFSLDWEDYGYSGSPYYNQMIQSAIDCEDTFYPMLYNKVYTVSQMIDNFRRGYNPARFIGIKHILDNECESENNKFPTNDSYLRFDLIYLLFVIFLFVIKPILIPTVILVHVLAFLLKYILGPILAIIAGSVITIVVLICYSVNILCFWCLGSKCEEVADTYSYVEKMLTLYKYFTNIPIPNLSYPDCELCNCKEGEPVGDGGASNPENAAVNQVLNQSGLNSILSKFTILSQYIISGFTSNELLSIQNILVGPSIDSNNPTSGSQAPQLQVFNQDSNGDNTYIFSTSLTLAERINLFNAKSKYFNNSPNNPGGGVNRIKVQFNVDLNPTQYHYDNTITIVCKDGQLNKFQTGKLLTFQDILLSSDVNLTGVTELNAYGTTSITGTPINTGSTLVTVSYANPNGAGTYSPPNAIYQISGSAFDASYAKFPMDVEYFQVITAMTYSTFSGICSTAPTIPGFSEYTLYNRFLNNTTRFNILENEISWSGTPFNTQPIDDFSKGEQQIVVFLVRGVDPYSTRTKVKYDLSRLFGYSWGNIEVSGQYKLNIPIQGKFKAIDHNIGTQTSTDTSYSGQKLYYDSYHFLPATSGPQSFSSFTSNLPFYYSKLDNTNILFQPDGGTPPMSTFFNNDPTYGVKVSSANYFTKEYNTIAGTCTSGNNYYSSSNSPSPYRNYLPNELIDGASSMGMDITYTPCNSIDVKSYYYGPTYPLTNSITYNPSPKIIMRSDRLPTSTFQSNNLQNSYTLQNNQNLTVFLLSDDGLSTNLAGTPSNSPNFGGPTETITGETPIVGSQIIDSFSCGGMVPLECYYNNPSCVGVVNEINIKNTSDGCYGNGTGDGEKIMVNGCYVLVTNILLSIGKDLKLITEWSSRIQITFGACREVWSHIFVNSWVNGTLFAYAIKNNRFYDSQNRPYSLYCTKTTFLHPTTNNFYYRSSPYSDATSEFIGADPISGFFGSFGGNAKNLKTPTTIIDLGPRSYYLQEIVMSDNYDGYIVNKLNATTFGDVTEILNFLIISRLTNTNFLGLLFGGGGANILSYFSRDNKRVDGDYAQLISINSELGVAPFEAENYPDNPAPCGQDPLFYNGANAQDGVIGIFFSSDTQLRDYLTPKRTIINDSVSSVNNCAFNNFSVFSQDVPFYQWEVKTGNPDNIFGSQQNEWYTTNDINGSSFFHTKYQSLDRINPGSRYFRTLLGATATKYDKGYIYSVDGSGNISGDVTFIEPNSPYPRTITHGAPFHFYFGLKKGKSAWDRFARKWIGFTTITD